MHSDRYPTQASHQVSETDIAIIGMSGRFPDANNIEAFWHNLQQGIESIQHFKAEDVAASGVTPELSNQPNYVPAKAMIEGMALFDAAFFGFTPREAEILDPQHRLFLECAWEALESAGYYPQTDAGTIGIFAGAALSQYFLNHIFGNPELTKVFSDYQLRLANDPEFLATRTAYKLNLTGPALMVQSACSTSLVAVHLASQSLLSGECDLALAGGVTLKPNPRIGYLYQEGMIFSPDGHCRAFDAKAKGTVGSQGVALVTLKRATDAIADHDTIYAVLKGSAINNDGAVKVGYTAPRIEGQAQVISEAQALANVDADTVTYIEAHGTGTELGDPIELAALTQAFRQSTDKTGFCAIGSLKTNMGHLNHAAGVAGLMKTALALYHRQIPPSLHFETPNPNIDFANSPFYVNTHLSDWPTQPTPRRAGVSSFGIGGTNAHVILEEAPIAGDESPGPNAPRLLLLSAKTPAALDQATHNLATHLQRHPNVSLLNVAYTLSVGRQAFDQRRMLVCTTVDEAIDHLQTANPQSLLTDCANATNRPVIFMFPGQGAQYVNMARDLYEQEPIFRAQVDRCANQLQPRLNLDLRQVLYPPPAQIDQARQQLQQTAITQPALFTIEYALAQLWLSWGIHPQGLIGHSIGEYVAACLAGVFSWEDALTLVAIRGQLMQQLPAGAMLSVTLAAEQVEPLLPPDLSIAVINEPARCVVSGPKRAIATWHNQLTTQGTESRILHTSHAFHSAMMDPILAEFARQVQTVSPQPPTLPFVSNVTGNWITATQAIDPHYWSQHLRAPVQFARGLAQCLQAPEQILLEVGPGRTLTTFAKRHPDHCATHRVCTSLRHPQETGSDLSFLLKALGQLWLTGVEVDWSRVYGDHPGQRIPLPTYPFQRQHFWIPPSPQASPADPIPPLKRQADMADWFYVPSWRRCPLPIPSASTPGKRILLFTDAQGLGKSLTQHLRQSGHTVMTVKVGSTFTQENDHCYVCNPEHPASYDRLLSTFATSDDIPRTIIHCWSLIEGPEVNLTTIDCVLEQSFYSLLSLVQTYNQHGVTDDVELFVISNQMQEVVGSESLRAATATVLGILRAIPQEYPHWHCRSLDLVWPAITDTHNRYLQTHLETELFSSTEDVVIAYRGQHRWVQTFEPLHLDSNPPPPLRPQGVYLITGGLGGIGLTIAQFLAETVQAKLVLLSRSPLSSSQQEGASREQAIQTLQNLGAEVLVLTADVADLDAMGQAMDTIQETFGPIHGVVHAAGLPASGAIALKTKAQAADILRAKVLGTLVLNQVLQPVQLDWWVLCSSLASVLNGFGQVDYRAANAFLDAFAHQQNLQTDRRTLALNWDAWQQVGMAAAMIEQENHYRLQRGAKQDRLRQKRRAHQLGLLPEEGVEVFSRVLSRPCSQILVSTRTLAGRLQNNPNDSGRLKAQLETTPLFPIAQGTGSSQQRPPLSTAYRVACNPTEQVILQVWQDALGMQNIGIDDNFFDLGGDSLMAVQILSKLREKLHTSLSLQGFLTAATVAELASTIEPGSIPALMPSGLDPLPPCLVKLHLGQSCTQPLFLVHSAGGNIFTYRALISHLDSAQTIWGLQPDLSTDLVIQRNIVEMATTYLEAVKRVQSAGPYMLGGHSFGGIVALEMAQQLKAQGEEIALLVVMDSNLVSDSTVTLQSQTDLLTFLLDMGAKEKTDQTILQSLPSEEQLSYFWQQYNAASPQLPDADYQPLLDFLQLFKMHHGAIANYQAKAYPDRVVFCKAQDPDAVTATNPEQGWMQITNHQVEVHLTPGNHLTMLNPPHVIKLAEIVNQSLFQQQSR